MTLMNRKLPKANFQNLFFLQEDFYYHTYGKKMVEKYRKMALKKFGESFFEEKNNFGAPVPPKGLRIKELPTFWEFIQFIRNERYRFDSGCLRWRSGSNTIKPILQ